MNLKKIVIKSIETVFYFFDLDVSIHKISSNISKTYIDKNIWEPFLNKKNNKFFKIYNESLFKSNSDKSNNFFKKLRFYSLFNIVDSIVKNNEYQNFLECGCWKGHSTYGIAEILRQNSFNKKFYVFDSFEGGLSNKISIDSNSKRYTQNKKEINNQKDYFKSNFEEVTKLLSIFDFVEIHKGWIPGVFENINNVKFSFIHIDLDLYQPTYDTIKFFYDSLEKDGVIICDDYNCSDFPGAKLAIDNFLKEKKYKFFYEIPLGGCIIIK
tara:strand:+ start:15860 stop:16663 length:804 start_codon:yes stop_codon:yes gene_type:complete